MNLTKRWPLGLDRKNWPDYLALLVLALFIMLFFDVYASRTSIEWSPYWREPFGFVTHFGLSDWVLIPSAIAFLICFIAYRFQARSSLWRRGLFEGALVSAFIFIAVGGPGLLTVILKRIFGRGRPVVYDDNGAFDFVHFVNDWTYQSFPSGHSTTAMATAIVVGFLLPRFFRLFLLLAVVAGVSRVVVGDHYPTDVLAGFAVGTLGAYAVRNVFASRGWLFRYTADGRVRFNGLPALRRAIQRARR